MLSRFIVLVFLMFISTCIAKRKATLKNIVRIEQFDNCPGVDLTRSDYNLYKNISIVNVGRGINVLNADYVVAASSKKVKGVYEVSKCRTNSIHDCELFGTYRHNDMCPMLVKKNYYWSPLFDNTHPTLKCPFRKIVYRMRNATIDGEKLWDFVSYVKDFQNYYWLSKTTYFQNNKETECKYFLLHPTQIKMQ